MPKIYDLIISEHQKPEWWPFDGEITLPLKEGVHEMDYDVMHELLSEEVNDLLYQSLCMLPIDKQARECEQALSLPVGVNLMQIRLNQWLLIEKETPTRE